METNKPAYDVNHWIVVLASFTSHFLVDGIQLTFGVLLIGLTEELNESSLSVAILGGVFLGVNAFSSPFAGSLSDAFGRRLVAVTGSVLFSSGLLGSVFAPNIYLIYLTFGVLGGVGYGLMYTPAIASVIEHKHRRGIASGIACSGSGVGSFVMSLVTEQLIETFGLRGTFLLLSGLMLNGIPCGLIFGIAQKSRLIAKDKADSTSTANIDEKRRPAPITAKLKNIFVQVIIRNNIAICRDFQCFCFFLSTFVYGLAYFVPFTFLPLQATALGVEKDKAAWLSSAIGLSNVMGRILASWIGSTSCIHRTTLLQCVFFLMAIAFPTSLLFISFETKLVFACTYGLLAGGFVILMPLALAEVVSHEKVGKTTGLFVFMLGGANLIGSPIAGWTIDETGDYVLCYIIAGGEVLLAFLILLFASIRRNCCGEKESTVDLEVKFEVVTHM